MPLNSKEEPRRIVLTGCTRGLGRALTARFVAAGHTVIGCGRSPSQIDELRRAYPLPHHFTPLDVVDAAAVQLWGETILAEYGPPQLLINNAAVINRPARLWEIPADEFDSVIDVNIKGVANVLRAFVPAMVAARQGVIVNLSSGWGRSTSPDVAPYCASKFAVEGLTQALAQELPAGMAAIPLNPGVINTEMLRKCLTAVPGGEETLTSGSSVEAIAEEAGRYNSPDVWSKSAADYILWLSSKANGRSLSVGDPL
jgi:NAD(P)-dependent dehydrogenase (short-subunit alcohol dehydrogenase family)